MLSYDKRYHCNVRGVFVCGRHGSTHHHFVPDCFEVELPDPVSQPSTLKARPKVKQHSAGTTFIHASYSAMELCVSAMGDKEA